MLWFRLARQDERLIAEAHLRGTERGLPTFDAICYGSDFLPVIELQGIRLASLPLEAQPLPRLEWQLFIEMIAPTHSDLTGAGTR